MPDQVNDWYYAIDNQQHGPVSFQALWSMATSLQLTSTDLVWREGMPDWRPARDVPDLAGALGGAAATGADAGDYDIAPSQPGAAAAAWPSPSYAHGQQQPAGAYPYAQQQSPYGEAVLPYGTYVRTGPSEARYAGFWIRFAAFIIDRILMTVVGWIVGFAIGLVMNVGSVAVAPPVRRSAGAPPDPRQMMAIGLAWMAGIAIEWLYDALMTSSEQQATLGKMAVGIRVVDGYGNRISFARATGRHFGKMVSGLICGFGYFMAGWDERKQSLHDKMASTFVTFKNG